MGSGPMVIDLKKKVTILCSRSKLPGPDNLMLSTQARENTMIHVIASITVKPGKVDEFIEIFKANVPNVLAEKGCIDYVPTIDADAGLPPQNLDPNIVTIIERWERLEDLHAHLKTPHMAAYREKVKDIVEGMSLKVLEEG